MTGGEHQGRQLRQSRFQRGWIAASIEHYLDGWLALALAFLDDCLAATRGCLPVHIGEAITAAERPQTGERRAAASGQGAVIASLDASAAGC